MKTILTILILTFAFVACTKKDEKKEYSKGSVYFEMKNETTLGEAQALMQNISKDDFQLNGFKFVTQTSFDSLSYFFKELESIEYLHVFDIIYDQNSEEATFRNMGFEDLTTSNYNNWETKLIENNFSEIFDSKKYGYMSVEKGTEEYWINELKNKSIISNADFVWVFESWCRTGE